MKHFEKYHAPEFSVREYLVPFLLQYGILIVCLMLHTAFVSKGPLLGAEVMVGDEMSSPTAGRLFFAVAAFITGIIFTSRASSEAGEGKTYVPFFFGMFAGTFFWQALGEDLWHFSVNGVHFVQLESVSVFPLVVVTVLFVIYAVRREILDWGVWCALLSFLCNWFGHYIMLGTYPFVAKYFETSVWNRGVAWISGIFLAILGVYLGIFSAKDRKGRMFAAIVTYIATGILAFGLMEG